MELAGKQEVCHQLWLVIRDSRQPLIFLPSFWHESAFKYFYVFLRFFARIFYIFCLLFGEYHVRLLNDEKIKIK